MTTKLIITLWICLLIIGCKNYQIINGDKSPILEGASLSSIKNLLKAPGVDTSNNRQNITIDYTRYSKEEAYYLMDKENKWELKFSGNYPDVHVKYVDSNFVILYCPVSGIINGLTASSSNHDDLFVINRKLGKKMMDIQSNVGGITKTLIKDNFVYFEYYEPDIVRYIKIKNGG